MTQTAAPQHQLLPTTQHFLHGQPKRLLISGEWQPAAGGETFDTRNPAAGAVLAAVAPAGVAHVERAVKAGMVWIS